MGSQLYIYIYKTIIYFSYFTKIVNIELEKNIINK